MHKYICNNPMEKMMSTPPWIVSNSVFSEKEVDDIVELLSKSGTDRGVIGGNLSSITNEEVRRSNVRFHNRNEYTSWIFNKLNSYVDNINQTFFNFDLIGFPAIQYTEYDAKELGHYDYHQDTFFGRISPGSDAGLRKLSVVVMLTDSQIDFEGGEFQITLGNQDKSTTIPLKKGDVVAFPSFMIHRVAPVTRGVRKSLVAWVIGPKFK